MLLILLIFELLLSLLNCLEYILIGYVMLGWCVFFGLLKSRENVFFRIYIFLMTHLEPIFAVIRRFLPSVFGLDFSPIVAFFILHLMRVLIVKGFFVLAYG